MITLEYLCPVNSRAVLLRKGQYYNVRTKAWEPAPADGVPTDDHKLIPSRLFDKGPNSDLWRVVLPVEVEDDLVKASVRVFVSDAAGKIGSKLGWYPVYFANNDPEEYSGPGVFTLSDVSIVGMVARKPT